MPPDGLEDGADGFGMLERGNEESCDIGASNSIANRKR